MKAVVAHHIYIPVHVPEESQRQVEFMLSVMIDKDGYAKARLATAHNVLLGETNLIRLPSE